MMQQSLKCRVLLWALISLFAADAAAEVGDPQIRTDHPWYPGELSASSFPRLFATQAERFKVAVGRAPATDQDLALAAWMWRNQHYAHGEEGKQDLWGKGFRGGDTSTREYWTGLYTHGMGLCGTTHAQWTVELNRLLGRGRSRTVGVAQHNSFEVFLKGDVYGAGRWALLDHDLSTVVFDPTGKRLLSIDEIRGDVERLTDRAFNPERQHGWPVGGLHPKDPLTLREFNVVEHFPGYEGPPPMVHLRRGESLRRYFRPGLEDGKTFVFWGRNYRTEGVPGPERSRTWINQPHRFYGGSGDAGYRRGQFRFGNAVYRYRPDFSTRDYREGVISESEDEIVFEFRTPYLIAATPADDSDWGIYESGCRNGLRLTGTGGPDVAISVDRGATWTGVGRLDGAMDLTDLAKGHQQYWIRFSAGANTMQATGLEMVTVCQANPCLFPTLSDDGCQVNFSASGQAIISAGPNLAQARQHLVAGGFDSDSLILELSPPRHRPTTRVYAAAHVASGNPPDENIRYFIDYSTDQGETWNPVTEPSRIRRRGVEPEDFWSQSFCYGNVGVPEECVGPIQIRFRNDGGKRILRAEAHLVYQADVAATRVTFAWTENGGRKGERVSRRAANVFKGDEAPWALETSEGVETRWVEFEELGAI